MPDKCDARSLAATRCDQKEAGGVERRADLRVAYVDGAMANRARVLRSDQPHFVAARALVAYVAQPNALV